MLIASALMWLFSSCNKEEEPYVSTNLQSIEFSQKGGTDGFYIYSNSSWSISTTTKINNKTSTLNILDVSPKSGNGDQYVNLYLEQNKFIYEIKITLKIMAGGETEFVTIRQKGNPDGIDENGNLNNGENDDNQHSDISAPTDVSASASGNSVNISWNSVSGADEYNVYRSRSASGNYSLISTVIKTSATDRNPLNGYNYYKVTAVKGNDESPYSAYAQAYVSNGSGNEDEDDDVNDKVPSAPTGVTVSNEGNDLLPNVIIRWNSVSNADYYYIYKSSSANGYYSKIGEMQYTSYADQDAPTNGASAYYKVKAVNSAGESSFSNYAKYTSKTNDEAFAPAFTYENCSVSGNTMTLRWRILTGNGYGKPTKIVLRVWNPYAEEWQDTNVNTTATSTSFNFSTKIDDMGFVKAGIVVSNSAGSYSTLPKIYDTKNKKWIN